VRRGAFRLAVWGDILETRTYVRASGSTNQMAVIRPTEILLYFKETRSCGLEYKTQIAPPNDLGTKRCLRHCPPPKGDAEARDDPSASVCRAIRSLR
jgi:hypothetical protein